MQLRFKAKLSLSFHPFVHLSISPTNQPINHASVHPSSNGYHSFIAKGISASVYPQVHASIHFYSLPFHPFQHYPSFVRWLPGCSCLCFSFFVFVRFPVWLLATRPHYQPPPAIHGMIISFIWPTIIHNQLPSIYLSINPSTCRSIHGCPSTQPMCGRSWSYVLSSSFRYSISGSTAHAARHTIISAYHHISIQCIEPITTS
jgi:hypothetical protein